MADRAVQLIDSVAERFDALDDARSDDFVESEHPRDATGKFASYKAGAVFKDPLKSAGFKKALSANGKLTYAKGQSKFVFEPPKAGKKQSNVWTHYAGPNDPAPKHGYGYKAFNDLMVAAYGAKIDPNAFSAEWKPSENSELNKPPKATEALASAKGLLESLKNPANASALVAPEPEQTQGADLNEEAALSKLAGTVSAASDLGYKYSKKIPNGAVFQKDNSKLMVKDNGEWTISTPGYQAKQGEGAAALELLLTGQMPSPPPWKNVPTPPELSGAPPANVTVNNTPVASVEWKPPQVHASIANVSPKLYELTKLAPQPTQQEYKAVHAYSGSSYNPINSSLRQGQKPHHNYADTIAKLTEYLDKASYPEDGVVYRKVSGDYSKILKSIAVEGMVFRDKGFISTSVNQGTWHGDLQMVMRVQKGAKGAAIAHMSNHKGEGEVLFQKGTKLRLTKIEGDTFYVDILND